MLTLHVPDMSCGHCSGVITKALKVLDADAVIGVDMGKHLVQVDTKAAPDAVLTAVKAAGYPATLAY